MEYNYATTPSLFLRCISMECFQVLRGDIILMLLILYDYKQYNLLLLFIRRKQTFLYFTTWCVDNINGAASYKVVLSDYIHLDDLTLNYKLVSSHRLQTNNICFPKSKRMRDIDSKTSNT